VPLNHVSISMGLQFGELPEFCGPDNLADLIISLRNSEELQFQGHEKSPLSDEGVRRIINLCYHASMACEEGRFPRFRVGCYVNDEVRKVASCDVALNSVESLRRLAPSVSGHQSTAICIEEDRGQLKCTGIAIVDDMGFSWLPGRPEITTGGEPTGVLQLRVEGPGQIRASEIGGHFATLRLSRSQIHQVVPYSLVGPVLDLLKDIAQRIIDSVAKSKGESATKYFGGNPLMLVEKLLAGIFLATTNLQHGGAFVILPTEKFDTQDFNINCKYPVNLCFGDLIVDYWISCINVADASIRGSSETELKQWQWKRERLFSSVSAIAGLSAVDGCVAFNKYLNVIGFGGTIKLGDSDAKIVDSPRKFVNAATGVVHQDEESIFKGLGTRHKSAFRLCKAYANCFVFVISQDGDLRVFFSDEESVYGFESLYAWVHSSDAT
jgi:hypothetical protein